MSLNIIDLIKGQLGSALVSQAATQLGESESGISKAIGGLLPTILGGLGNNSNNSGVLDAISGAASSGILGNLLGGSSNNSMISGVISSIFGDKVGGIIDGISSYAGISNSSSSSLLNMVTGATLGSIGKHASDNNLDASGLSGLLGGFNGGMLSSLLPAGLSLGSLGLDNLFGDAQETLSNAASSIKETASNVGVSSNNDDDNMEDNSIWKWLLPLLLLLAAAFFLWKQIDKKGAEGTDASGVTTDSLTVSDSSNMNSDSATAVVASTDKVAGEINLNGLMIKGYKGGMEENMITFLKSGKYKDATDDEALKSTWFTFDNVNFKSGSSTELDANSIGQLDNILAILKAFPESKIKIGGYTDKSGDEAGNKKLSKQRADYIKKWLSDKGVGVQVIGAEGYGSDFATLPATASVEERAVDRKMAIRFAK